MHPEERLRYELVEYELQRLQAIASAAQPELRGQFVEDGLRCIVQAAFSPSSEESRCRYEAEVAQLNLHNDLVRPERQMKSQVRAKFCGGSPRALLPGQYIASISLNHSYAAAPTATQLFEYSMLSQNATTHEIACLDYFASDFYSASFFNRRAAVLSAFAQARGLADHRVHDFPNRRRALVKAARANGLLAPVRANNLRHQIQRAANEAFALYIEAYPYWSTRFGSQLECLNSFCGALNHLFHMFLFNVLPPAAILLVGAGNHALEAAGFAPERPLDRHALTTGVAAWRGVCVVGDARVAVVNTHFIGNRAQTGPRTQGDYEALGTALADAAAST